MKAGMFACAAAWLSSTVKCDNIAEDMGSLSLCLRHRKQERTVVLTPEHIELRAEALYRVERERHGKSPHKIIRT